MDNIEQTKQKLKEKADELAQPQYHDGISFSISIRSITANHDLNNTSVIPYAFNISTYDIRLPNPVRNNGSNNIPSSLSNDIKAMPIDKDSVIAFDNLTIASAQDIDNLIEVLQELKNKYTNGQ